jgi:hypothetical protein
VIVIIYQTGCPPINAESILYNTFNIMAAPVEEMQQLAVEDAVPNQEKPKKEKKPKADKPKKDKPAAGTLST